MSFHQIKYKRTKTFWVAKATSQRVLLLMSLPMSILWHVSSENERHEKSGREPMSDTVNLDLTAWLLEFLGFLRGFTVATSRLVGFIVNNNFVCSNLGFFPAPYVHWRVLWSRTTTLCHFWFCQTVFFFALSLSFFSQSLFQWSKTVPVFFFYQNWKQAASSWRTAFLSHSSVCVQGFPLQNNLLVLI